MHLQIKVLGRICVRDTSEGLASHTMLVLCECKQVIDATLTPSEVTPDKTGEPWTVMVVPAKETLPESIICTVGEILEKTAKPSGDSSAYRRSCTFSAIMLTPMGEESMENGMMHCSIWRHLESTFVSSGSGKDLYFQVSFDA